MKIVAGTCTNGIVKIKQPQENGNIVEMEVPGCMIIGTMSTSSDNQGYVIFNEDQSLFILQNPAASVSECLKVLIASVNQLTTLIDQTIALLNTNLTVTMNTNFAAIAAGITAANSQNGAYAPVPLAPLVPITPTMVPMVQAATNLQKLTVTTTANAPKPEVVETEGMSSEDIEVMIENQEKIEKMQKEAFTSIIDQVKSLLSPIQSFIDMLNSFSMPSIDMIIGQIESIKQTINDLKEKKEVQEQKEAEEKPKEDDFVM